MNTATLLDMWQDEQRTDGVAVTAAAQTPGLVVSSKPAVQAVSSPPDGSVTDSHEDLPGPVRLPVAGTGPALSAQQLQPDIEPVRVDGVRLLVHHRSGRTASASC